MKHAPFRFTMLWFLSAFCLLQSSARSAELPSWVEAVKEPLVFSKAAPPAYLEITQTATIARPKAVIQAETLEKLNPGVMQVLPGLRDLVGSATVSSKFKTLYDAKIEAVKNGNVMSASSFFDCATVLNVKNAKTGRRAVIFQSDMETDTDGSDPVRLSQLSDYDDARVSRSYQPILAYSWNTAEADAPVNPFLKYYDERLGQLRGLQAQVAAFAKADHGPFWSDMREYLEDHEARLDRNAKYFGPDLQSRRSLIASLDPFIVIPSTWVDEKMRVGDYVAVVHAGQVYPCIIGDTGPTAKAGEASQKLARALNPKASGRMSAVTTVSVTYIVFPETRTASGVPDLAKYEKEVSRLIEEIGGLGSAMKLHVWE